MTKLDCNVTSCLHNAEDCCCKSAIIVEGTEAKDKCDTCCGSYDENREGSFQNLFKSPENKLEVDCEAIKCVYNEDRHCIADHIGIAGDGAKEACQTQCASFVTR